MQPTSAAEQEVVTDKPFNAGSSRTESFRINQFTYYVVNKIVFLLVCNFSNHYAINNLSGLFIVPVIVTGNPSEAVKKNPEKAREFVNDVKAGLPDDAIRKKYNLSNEKFFIYKAAALDFLAGQRTRAEGPKRTISAKEILADMKAGMDDNALMTKYELTARQLQSVFRQIIRAGLATAMELSSRLSITKSQVREAFEETGKAIRELD